MSGAALEGWWLEGQVGTREVWATGAAEVNVEETALKGAFLKNVCGAPR